MNAKSAKNNADRGDKDPLGQDVRARHHCVCRKEHRKTSQGYCYASMSRALGKIHGVQWTSGHKESREYLLTLVERKTRLEVILKLPNKAAVAVRQAFDQLERQLGGELFRTMFRSITLDNGVEFSLVYDLERAVLTKDTRTTLYFAHTL